VVVVVFLQCVLLFYLFNIIHEALFRFDSRAYSVNTAVLLLAGCSFEAHLVCNKARISLIKPFYS